VSTSFNTHPLVFDGLVFGDDYTVNNAVGGHNAVQICELNALTMARPYFSLQLIDLEYLVPEAPEQCIYPNDFVIVYLVQEEGGRVPLTVLSGEP
jgi:hypothetical protein